MTGGAGGGVNSADKRQQLIRAVGGFDHANREDQRGAGTGWNAAENTSLLIRKVNF